MSSTPTPLFKVDGVSRMRLMKKDMGSLPLPQPAAPRRARWLRRWPRAPPARPTRRSPRRYPAPRCRRRAQPRARCGIRVAHWTRAGPEPHGPSTQRRPARRAVHRPLPSTAMPTPSSAARGVGSASLNGRTGSEPNEDSARPPKAGPPDAPFTKKKMPSEGTTSCCSQCASLRELTSFRGTAAYSKYKRSTGKVLLQLGLLHALERTDGVPWRLILMYFTLY
jgi:hypothetical protein